MNQHQPDDAATVVGETAADRLGSWVELHEERCRGDRWYRVLVNRRERVGLTLTAEEADLVRRLNEPGGPTAPTAHSLPSPPLLGQLRDAGFLVQTDPAAHPVSTGRLHRLRAFTRTLDLGSEHGARLIAHLYRHGARWAFTRPAVIIQALFALAGLAAVVHTLVHPSQMSLTVSPAQVPLALSLSLIAIAVHECAHGLVVVHNGRRVDAVGFKLHLGTPAFYVESIDSLLLPRRQRLLQAAAGSWAEWLVTSLAALWVWVAPTSAGLALVHRFVILNSITICSNLLPFVGLDGHLLVADLLREPDLGESTRGATSRLISRLLARQRVTVRDWALATYNVVNGAVATALLLLAALFWYALFGGTLTTLAHAGPLGWALLAALAVLLLRPALTSAAPRAGRAVRTIAELGARARFRLQWRWRIPAIEALAEHDPALRDADDSRLGILAGTLIRTRLRRVPADAAPYAYIHRYGRRRVHFAGQASRVVPARQVVTYPRGTVLITLPAS